MTYKRVHLAALALVLVCASGSPAQQADSVLVTVSDLAARPGDQVLVPVEISGVGGREIVSGRRSVRIFGVQRDVKARVVQLNGFSAHADESELFRWYDELDSPPKRIFVTHGEDSVAEGFARKISDRAGVEAIAPDYGDTVEL